jgi:hypothetical protein
MRVLGGSPCTAVTPTCTVQGGRVVLAHNWGSLTHPHPQNSGCPSVVLWTPCSGVEWRVFEPHQGLEKLYWTDVYLPACAA